MQGAQNLRSEAYLAVRRNDEGEAQRRRWTFYEAINLDLDLRFRLDLNPFFPPSLRKEWIPFRMIIKQMEIDDNGNVLGFQSQFR